MKMSLDDAIEKAQSQPGIVEERGELVWRRGDSFVVYDRNKGEFVRSGCITIPAEKEQEKGVRGWLKERAEVIAEHYQHWKDLVNIAGKYGLWTAVQYEAQAIENSLNLLKLYFVMAIGSDYEGISVADHQPNPIVQVDEPKLPRMPEGTSYLGHDDYRWRDEELFGDNFIFNCNKFSLGTGPDKKYKSFGDPKPLKHDTSDGDAGNPGDF